MELDTHNVLVLGGGGREHAIVWKLALSCHVNDIYVYPGSYAIGQINKAKIVDCIDLKDFDSIARWCKANQIKLVVVGPEDPLADGIADVLVKHEIPCFGPTKAAARIEWDKSWSKDFMRAWGIPTAKYQSFTDVKAAKQFILTAPYDALVVKASGLAAGKGVVVAANREEACQAVDEILGNNKFGGAGNTIVIEEKLSGEEVSLLAFVDGSNVKVMQPVQDHKRLANGDMGPNTGGMGAYCPCPVIDAKDLKFAIKEIIEKAVAGFRSSTIHYCGVLYAGIMLTPDGPKCLEFNCRFGDPETQVLLPLMTSDLFSIMLACCEQRLSPINLEWKQNMSAVGVVMASKGYPETSTKGCDIPNLDATSSNHDHYVFHSGTVRGCDGIYRTNGGRVLINVALSSDLRVAADTATKYCEKMNFFGAQFRTDIAHKAFKYIQLSYKDSGVDIVAGDNLVRLIKPMAKQTQRAGVVGGLGGFGGLFKINELSYQDQSGKEVAYVDPVFVESTSGIGAILKLAIKHEKYETIGNDLVAQCVNEVLSYGAQPFAFLDYFACGKLIVPMAAKIVNGIANGCVKANCALLGGETAEMPALFEVGSYDLAGYCVGVVDYTMELPSNHIQNGDILLGLPSNGFHCSGYDLVHEVMSQLNEQYDNVAPFSQYKLTYVDEFIRPSNIYVSTVLPWIYKRHLKGIVNISTGGLLRGVEKLLSGDLAADIDASKWEVPSVYGWLSGKGKMSTKTILHNFNLGIGMVVVVSKSIWENNKFDGAVEIGRVTRNDRTRPIVSIKNVVSTLASLSQQLGYETEIVNENMDECIDETDPKKMFIKSVNNLAVSTYTPNIIASKGSFGKRMFRLKATVDHGTYADPILIIGTDGIGSKLEIGKKINKLDTIGIDLVAMCVNDILCNGAEPLTFLDYYACNKVDQKHSNDILTGVIDGVKLGASSLVGGHTIEVPHLYKASEFDMAGFALGIVESSAILPKTNELEVGDVVIGLPSDGVHSNGFSLVHKVMQVSGHSFDDPASFSACRKTYGEEFLVPTKIYTNAMKSLLKERRIKAVAHITGGGLLENIPRVLPSNLTVELNFNCINIPPIFAWLASKGNISHEEMQRTYNCGIGMVLVVSPPDVEFVVESLLEHRADVIGKIIERSHKEPQVRINPTVFGQNISRVQRLLSQPVKRVAVLISGNGSNLQALIDATRNSTMGIRAEIVFVLSNKENVFGLERARLAGIDNTCLSHRSKSREEFDAAVSALLESRRVDIVCLAGFMRILSGEFVRKWKGRLINIHPSLLPKYPGLHVQRQALEAGELRSGCTVHFVDEGVDTGRIIFQRSVVITDGETEESLTKKIHRAEYFAYPHALRMLVNGQF